MRHAIYDPGQEDRPAWHVERKLGAKRPLLPKQVWAVRFFLAQERRLLSRTDRLAHLSTRQYARLVGDWVTAIGLRCEIYGTHSLRRTAMAALIYKQTGNLRAVQILLGHTKIETTVRYLGVKVEDALALAEATEV